MTEPTDVPTPENPTPSDRSKSRRDNWLWAGLLVILTLIVYQPAIRGDFVWDDNRYVMMGINTPLREVGGLARIWLHPSTTNDASAAGFTTVQYYPLTFTAFWVQYHLWGLNTVGYHAVNILLHAGSALILWQLLRLLRVPGAWVIAAIFAVHPIEVESVAWITELKNVLSGLFFLASVYAYLRFAGGGVVVEGEAGEGPSGAGREVVPTWGWYALSFVFFVCAVFSKTVTSLMPVVTVLLLYWRFRPRLNVRTVAGLVPFLALGVLLSRQTAWMEKHVVGAMGEDWNLTFVQRVLVAGRAFWFYVGKILAPFGLTFTYPRWNPDPGLAVQWVYVAAAGAVVLAAVAWLLVGKRYRGVAVAVLCYAVLLFPAMGFFNVYPMRFSFVADHFQYLAGVALIALVVGGVASLVWRGERAPGAQGVQGVAAAVILVCAILTWRQAGVYASPITLWEDTLAKNPDAWMAHYNLGTELARRGLEERAAGDAEGATKDLNAAVEHFERTIALRPRHANAYGNWAAVLLEMGKPEEAIAKARESLAIEPNADEPHITIGQALARLNRPAEARAEYEAAIKADPKSSRAYVNLARLQIAQGKYPEAEASLRRAEQIHPNDATIEYLLATVLDHQYKVKEALEHGLRAAELRPDDAEMWAELGFLWGENGRPREAFDAFRRALEIDPNNAKATEGAKTLVEAVGKMKRAATTRSATRPAATTGPGATRPFHPTEVAATRPAAAAAGEVPATGPAAR